MTAETIIVNGAVRTMDPAQPVAEAVAIADGRILATGTTAEIEAMATGGTSRIDAGGGSVLPGFIESHAHLFIGGAELENLQLANCADPKLVGEMIRDFAAAHPDRPMVVAQAPDYGVFGDRAPRLLLDEILKDRPLALMGALSANAL